jgi:hypothetical protein
MDLAIVSAMEIIMVTEHIGSMNGMNHYTVGTNSVRESHLRLRQSGFDEKRSPLDATQARPNLKNWPVGSPRTLFESCWKSPD